MMLNGFLATAYLIYCIITFKHLRAVIEHLFRVYAQSVLSLSVPFELYIYRVQDRWYTVWKAHNVKFPGR